LAIQVFQVTLGAAATPIINPATNPAHKTPVQEIHLNPAAHDYTFGPSTVTATLYVRKITTAGATAAIVGNGPAAIAIDVLENLYLFGTQNDVVNVGVVTL
jgi:hypothetical protein